MYKLFSLLLILFVSCVTVPKNIENYEYDFPNDLPKFRTVQQAATWVAQYMEYKKDFGETWQPPEVSYKRGKGDCEDHVILFLYLVENKIGIDDTFLVSFRTDKGTYHAMAEVNGVLWETTNGTRGSIGSKTKIIKIEYELAVWLAVEQKNAMEYVKNKLDELK